MDISWSDVNHVQEPGDYPFRDGTISVTFVEVAIWKKNASAQFQLMRKHPIRERPAYLLGKQVDERSAPTAEELIYESSNGDRWSLAPDPATGARAVIHVPNARSGGRTSYISIEKFLAEGANAPRTSGAEAVVRDVRWRLAQMPGHRL
jgi:hypothetical protein